MQCLKRCETDPCCVRLNKVTLIHEGKTKEENNGNVIFQCKIHGSAGKYGDGEGGEASFRMPDPFLL